MNQQASAQWRRNSQGPQSAFPATVAAVVIGRNEGKRLTDCLISLKGIARTIYVDSGSTDASVEVAETLGVEVIELDASRPFNAARARNAGFAALAVEPPDFVQFIDGDCILHEGWIAAAADFLTRHPQAAVACGRRRERRPEASVYNKLCDMEWDTPVGRTRACGGDALMRYTALLEAGGYRDDLIAGEEPELCVRLRAAGWQIWRLPAEMTLHDADITKLRPWLRRVRRAGYAFAQGAALHGGAPEYHWVRETRRAMVWGGLLPLAALAAGALHPAGLLLLLAYPAQVVRLALRGGIDRRGSWQQAFFLTLGRFPEAQGIIGYYLVRFRASRPGPMEYK